MKNISKYITFEEAITSQTAVRNKILNVPNDLELINMQLVGIRVFDVIREHFKTPIRVSSFFRNRLLNNCVGGSKTSQHVKGQAIDIQGTGKLTNQMIFDYVKENIDFDQLIHEYGTDTNPAWVHISYVSKEKNRKQVLYIK
jgi:zinc D-Ala-D-Ala carboxypeptidase